MEILKNKIISIEDVDKEIEEVKKRIQLQEGDLAETLKTLPHQTFRLAVKPVSEAVLSTFGGSLLFKRYDFIKNFLAVSKEKTEENKPETKSSFISTSIKNFALINLLKVASRIIRYI